MTTEKGGTGGPRVVQVVVATHDMAEPVRFYRNVFGAPFMEDISSFQFGTSGTDSFFLLTADNWHENPAPSSFGVLVPDVNNVHRRAIEAGASEVDPPMDYAWKPRSSIIDDPSGNRILLSQA
jgi:predicted enzyme related to lactoylglutathione lyase